MRAIDLFRKPFKRYNSLNSISRKEISILVFTILLLAAIPITVVSVREAREPASRAQPIKKTIPAPVADSEVYELVVRYDPTNDSLQIVKKGKRKIYGHQIYGDPPAVDQPKYERWDFDIQENGSSLFKAPFWIEKEILNTGGLSQEIKLFLPIPKSKTTATARSTAGKRIVKFTKNKTKALNLKDPVTKKLVKQIEIQ